MYDFLVFFFIGFGVLLGVYFVEFWVVVFVLCGVVGVVGCGW